MDKIITYDLEPEKEFKDESLVMDGGGISRTLRSRDYKGALKLMEVMIIDEQNGIVKKDVVGTITTDGSSPKHNNRIAIKQATSQGYAEMEVGGGVRFELSKQHNTKRESSGYG